jgi:GT2 family glycosyltransferase
MMRLLLRLLLALPLTVGAALLMLAVAVALALTDLLWWIAGRRLDRTRPDSRPATRAASVVIPSWNGRDLLARNLPSVVAALEGHPDNEIIVVDNGSTDGTAEFLRSEFPRVRVIRPGRNLGFAGGANAGVREASNDIVVLLNNDMRVDAHFLGPLLEGFQDGCVFAVSCQIFFSDPARRREETGLTEGWWENGSLRVRHRVDDGIRELFPCFYGGGGSCAFDRRKFLELGGFDELYAPFYLEDADLGYRAWKRGWKVLYQPRSIVWHEHRGTIGKHFRPAQIERILKRNFLLFAWKNIHEWRRLVGHFFFTLADGLVSAVAGDSPERSSFSALWRAVGRLPAALAARWRARSASAIGDEEAFRRPLGGHFRDRFQAPEDEDRLRVLFVSPYPICPPVHGGGVFMLHTLRALARHAEVHLIALLDKEEERRAHEDLRPFCASMEFLVRPPSSPGPASLAPHAVRELALPDLHWLIHRQIYLGRCDVIQLEYTPLAQYHGDYRNLLCALFEHDIYFQSLGRALREKRGALWKVRAAFEYLRALRYELRTLPRFDHIQVCSRENREYLLSFLPALADRVRDGLRAGIETSHYPFRPDGREPDTMLFLGSFRHLPNQAALQWFVREVLPRVLALRPSARLVVVGSDPPPRYGLSGPLEAIELRGRVEDVREPLGRYAVFRVPDPQRLGGCVSSCWRPSQRGFPSSLRGSAPKAWRGETASSAIWRTTPRRSPGAWSRSWRTPAAPAPWWSAPGKRWSLTGTARSSPRDWRRNIAKDCDANGRWRRRRSLFLQIALEAFRNAPRRALNFVGRGIARALVGGPQHRPRARIHQKDRAATASPARNPGRLFARGGLAPALLLILLFGWDLRRLRRVKLVHALLESLAQVIREHGVSLFGIGHHLKDAHARQTSSQVLIQTMSHGQQVDRPDARQFGRLGRHQRQGQPPQPAFHDIHYDSFEDTQSEPCTKATASRS